MSRILLVEDNELNRDMLKRRLEKRDYEVLIAVDGEEVISTAKSESPDLVLMDLSLPMIDGWETSRRLKSEQKTQHNPITAMTANAMRGDREKALDAGCDDYDTKPVERPRLLEKIEAILEKSTSA